MAFKYLITGASGQLGQEIALRIDTTGGRTLSFSRGDLDITDLCSVRANIDKFRPDVIINCASYNSVDRAEIDWENAYMVNGIGTKNLAIAATEADIPLVHFSSHFVFDGRKNSPYTIADKPNPINRYGESKLLGEEEVRSLMRKYIIIRTGWLFGDRGSSSVCFPAKLLSWMKERDALSIVDDQIASPSYAGDLISVTMALLEKKAWGLYHFNNIGECSKYEWAKYVARKTRWSGKISPSSSDAFSGGASRPAYAVLDIFPLKKFCDHAFIPTWEDGVNRFLESLNVPLP